MKGKTKKKIVIVSTLLALCLAVGAGSQNLLGLAVFDESSAVHINPDDIEPATMIIGTHLIYLGELNDELYQIAVKSQEESGQYNIYYKSELADGAWYEISTASAISDITEQKTAIDRETISQLYLTHHTKSDGNTYDLRLGSAVGIYDIYPVYDLERMEELSQIKNQYDMYREGNKNNATTKRNLTLIKDFFATEVVTEQTQVYDLQLRELQNYLQVLRTNAAPQEEIDTVTKIMGKVDASRRAAVYQTVGAALERLLDAAASEQGLEEEEELTPDAALHTAISESQASVESSLAQQEGTMLSESTTVLSKEEYALANRLITAALSQNHAECDIHTNNLIHLYHITDGEVTDTAGEKELLDQELIPLAEQIYAQGLATGETEEYKNAAAQNSSHVVLENMLNTQKNLLNMYRSELQFYIEARTKRCAGEEAQSYVSQRLEQTNVFIQRIPQDKAYDSAKATVEEHTAWLQSLLAEVVSGGGETELSSLYGEKQVLQEKRLQALDQQDLAAAKQMEALIEEKDREIGAKEAAITQELQRLSEEKTKLETERTQVESQGGDTSAQDSQITSLDSQITVQSAGLNEGSVIQSIQQERAKIQTLLEGELTSGDQEELSQSIQAVSALVTSNSAYAGQTLKECYQKMAAKKYLDETEQYDAWMDEIEEVIAESTDTLDGIMDGKEAVAALEEILDCQLTPKEAGSAEGESTNEPGGSGEENTQEHENAQNESAKGSGTTQEQVVALIALAMYNEQADKTEINEVLAGLVQSMYKVEDSYLFQVVNESSGVRYASAKAVSAYTGCRYIWNDNKKKAVLASGKKQYGFYAFKKEVEREGKKEDTLTTESAFLSTVYIPEDYVKQEFGCQVYPIGDTGYAVLADEELLKDAAGVLDALIEKGGDSMG